MKYGDKVTIISLSYKNYKDIYKTIESVLNQDYPSLELIVSDDGYDLFPKDEIISYIEKNKQNNLLDFVVRKNDKNVGTVKHENIVCSLVENEYIIELSCGDMFYSNESVSKIVQQIEKTNSDILAYRRLVCDSTGQPLYYYPHLRDIKRIMMMNRKDQYEAIISGYFYNMISGSAIAYKTSFIQKMKYDEKYTLMEDCPLFTKYTNENKIDFCYDFVGIKYVLGGVSNTHHPLILEDMAIYNASDRIKDLHKVGFFTREKVKYQIARARGDNLILVFLRFPLIVLWLIFYKVNDSVGIYQDGKEIKRCNVCK